MQSIKILLLLLASLAAVTASAQTKLMKLSPDLAANSNPMEARAKGIATIMKYQFGNYGIASGKAGWIKGRSNSRLFSFTSEGKSKQKVSFVFVDGKKDSVVVNISINANFRELNTTAFPELPQFSRLMEQNNNLVAFLSPLKDSITWEMIMLNRMGSEVENNFAFEGWLSHGDTRIEIRPVREWTNGKSAMMKAIIGYEFHLNDQAVAATQASINSFHKKYVWIKDSLPDDMKLLLGSASATLMLMVDDQAAKMDSE